MLPARLTGSGLLLIFLAGIIVCFCGMLGYQHAPMLDGSEPPRIHLSEAPSGFTDGLQEDHGSAGSVHTTALFVVSLGAALGLMLGAARKWLGIGAVLTGKRFPPPIVLPPPRMPARPHLQVFLL